MKGTCHYPICPKEPPLRVAIQGMDGHREGYQWGLDASKEGCRQGAIPIWGLGFGFARSQIRSKWPFRASIWA